MLAGRDALMDDRFFAEARHVQHAKLGALRTQSRDELVAVEAGHHHVSDHQIRFEAVVSESRKRFFTAASRRDVIATPFEHARSNRADAGLVIHEQD